MKGYFFKKKYLNKLILTFLLLICCKQSYAVLDENSSTENVKKLVFTQLIEQVKVLQNENSGEALALLNNYQQQSLNLPLKQRLTFEKLHAEIFLEQAHYQKAKEITSAALSRSLQLNSPSIIIAQLSYIRGFARESLGDISGATQDYLTGLEVAESLNNKKSVAKGLTNLGAIYYLSEKYERSLIMLNDALSIVNGIDDEEMKGFVNGELGILYAYLRQDKKSLAFYQASYEHYVNAGKTLFAVNALRNIATNHAANKRYDEAIITYKKIIPQAKTLYNNEIMAGVYSGMAWAYLKNESKDPEAAYHYIQLAGEYVTDAEQIGAKLAYAIDKAYILFELERYDESLDSALLAETLLGGQSDYLVSSYTIDLLNITAKNYYQMASYQLAYQQLSALLTRALEIRAKKNSKAIETIRLKYESEQADIRKQLLESRESEHLAEFGEMSLESSNSQRILIIVTIIVGAIGLFLLKIFRNQQQLRSLSRKDPLTSVYNRSFMFKKGVKLLNARGDAHSNCQVVVFDIVAFNQINKIYGYQRGDEVLKEIAALGKKQFNCPHLFGRLDGDHFFALTFNLSSEEVSSLAASYIEAANNLSWSFGKETKILLRFAYKKLAFENKVNNENIADAMLSSLYQLHESSAKDAV